MSVVYGGDENIAEVAIKGIGFGTETQELRTKVELHLLEDYFKSYL